jgi:hypothetical protein
MGMYCAVGLSAMGTVRFKYDSGRKKITGLLRALSGNHFGMFTARDAVSIM